MRGSERIAAAQRRRVARAHKTYRYTCPMCQQYSTVGTIVQVAIAVHGHFMAFGHKPNPDSVQEMRGRR